MLPFIGCHFAWGQLGIFKDVFWHIFTCGWERYLIGVGLGCLLDSTLWRFCCSYYWTTFGASIFESSSSWRQPRRNSSSVRWPSPFSSIRLQENIASRLDHCCHSNRQSFSFLLGVVTLKFQIQDTARKNLTRLQKCIRIVSIFSFSQQCARYHYYALSIDHISVALSWEFMLFLSRVKFYRAVSRIWNSRVANSSLTRKKDTITK